MIALGRALGKAEICFLARALRIIFPEKNLQPSTNSHNLL